MEQLAPVSSRVGKFETGYPARTAYLEESVVARYELDRFSGTLGRFRHRREKEAVTSMLDLLPEGKFHFLDVPCGNGRWWEVIASRSTRIDGVDISPAMIKEAETRALESDLDASTGIGDAEALPFPDSSFDVVFSNALMKHLPIPVQYRVLSELARVSRKWVICSFSIVHPVTYQIWRVRNFLDSHPILPEQLKEMAGSANLKVVAKRRSTTPIGVEYCVLLTRMTRRDV